MVLTTPISDKDAKLLRGKLNEAMAIIATKPEQEPIRLLIGGAYLLGQKDAADGKTEVPA